MPVRIDAACQSLWGLGVECRELMVRELDERGTVVASHMQRHEVGIALIEAVAVDAASHLCVLNDCPLTAVLQTGLIDAHLCICLITRLYESVSDAIVNAVGADVNAERSVGTPSVSKSGTDLHEQTPAHILLQQSLPLVGVDRCRCLSLCVQFTAFCACKHGIDHQCAVILHREIERSNIGWYCHADIVRIDFGLAIDHLCIGDLLHSASRKQCNDRKIYNMYMVSHIKNRYLSKLLIFS